MVRSPFEDTPGHLFEEGPETSPEAALDRALESLTHTGWQDVDATTASSTGDIQQLVKVAAELRRTLAATPSQQARLRHQAIISRTAWGLRAGARRTLHLL